MFHRDRRASNDPHLGQFPAFLQSYRKDEAFCAAVKRWHASSTPAIRQCHHETLHIQVHLLHSPMPAEAWSKECSNGRGCTRYDPSPFERFLQTRARLPTARKVDGKAARRELANHAPQRWFAVENIRCEPKFRLVRYVAPERQLA